MTMSTKVSDDHATPPVPQPKETVATSAAPEVAAPASIGKRGTRASLWWGDGDPGREAAFTGIVQRQTAFVCRTLRRNHVRERHLDDVAVDVFMRLARWMQKKRTPRRERALLGTMARREALSYVRRGCTVEPIAFEDLGDDMPESRPGPEGAVYDAQLAGLLRTALAEMDEGDRVLLLRIDLDDEPYAEVAESLGRKPHAVYAQLRRARRDLRERVEGLCDAADLGWALCAVEGRRR
jgi:RNA polymerase sigma factor (sigma-70 family)